MERHTPLRQTNFDRPISVRFGLPNTPQSYLTIVRAARLAGVGAGPYVRDAALRAAREDIAARAAALTGADASVVRRGARWRRV